jgi:hypothetical protein
VFEVSAGRHFLRPIAGIVVEARIRREGRKALLCPEIVDPGDEVGLGTR